MAPGKGARAARRAASAALAARLSLMAVAAVATVGAAAAGFPCHEIASASMGPALPQGALVWVDARAEAASIEPGEVVAYVAPSGAVVGHRAVANDREAAELTTTGDANAAPDAAPVPYGAVIGRAVLRLDGAGAALAALRQNRAGALAAVGAADAALVAAACLPGRRAREGAARGEGLREGP